MSNCKPIVKWAGGKSKLVPDIKKLAPKGFNDYIEPFVGGGSVVFGLSPINTIIGDINPELINTYKVVKTFPDDLMSELDEMEKEYEKDPENYYYKVRKEVFNPINQIHSAARFIFLNKAGFNGLYRVNRKGEFNVGWGKKPTINTYDRNNLLSVSEFLTSHNIRIICSDYEEVAMTARAGDFVYFDPPYTYDKPGGFVGYTKTGFGLSEQERLFNVFKTLSERGVYCMLSNNNTQYIREVYKDYNIHVVYARRNINCNGAGRGNVEEVLITNYQTEEGERND